MFLWSIFQRNTCWKDEWNIKLLRTQHQQHKFCVLFFFFNVYWHNEIYALNKFPCLRTICGTSVCGCGIQGKMTHIKCFSQLIKCNWRIKGYSQRFKCFFFAAAFKWIYSKWFNQNDSDIFRNYHSSTGMKKSNFHVKTVNSIKFFTSGKKICIFYRNINICVNSFFLVYIWTIWRNNPCLC